MCGEGAWRGLARARAGAHVLDEDDVVPHDLELQQLGAALAQLAPRVHGEVEQPLALLVRVRVRVRVGVRVRVRVGVGVGVGVRVRVRVKVRVS